MIPWSVTMRSTLIFSCVLATWLFTTIGAITVSIDRSDNKPAPTRSSMIANGWRPLTSGYEETIGTNVSPSSNLERNAPAHPVHGKLQKHMATSEKLKPQKSKPPPPPPLPPASPSHQDYNPPSILGSFTVFGHAAAKARGEAQPHNHPIKHVAQETQEYTFLLPPPKDAYRFDLDHHRKPILRDNAAYVRHPQYVPQNLHQPLDPIRAATYFIKGYTSTTNSPSSPTTSSKNRHYAGGYNVPQMLQPPRQQAKPFESLKVPNNAKPYFQPPGIAIASDFGKDKRGSEYDHRGNYEKYQSPLVNPPNPVNYYAQTNHQSHHYKTSYERDPAFLVHESHEVSYVTPSSIYNGFNFRPSLPYETLLPPEAYASSTPTPTTAPSRLQTSNKYVQSNDVAREHEYKRPGQSTTVKQTDNAAQTEVLPTSAVTSTYYVSEQQDLTPPPSAWPVPKSKYNNADINEVLPRVNPPAKFNQEPIAVNQIPQIPQMPKIVYVRPQVHQQQQQNYQSPLLPIDVHQQTSQPEYETPESISLKHFNEQQFLIQQQLLQRDRQRLAEQERQQQLEIERQQQEELKKRQEELRQLIQQQKEDEEARLAVEAAKNQSEQLTRVTDEQTPYTIQLAQFEIPKVTTDGAAVITQQNNFGQYPEVQQPQVLQVTEHFVSEAPINQNYEYQEQLPKQLEEEQINYQEPQTEVRPQRPKTQKPSRDQYRRRKPTTVAYDVTPTEAPIEIPETSVPLTLHIDEVPVQTTVAPETTTLPTIATQRPRTRRPGSPSRRRRPSTTTQEPITVPTVEEFLKYDRPDEVQQQQNLDNSRRRRIKPTQQTFDETVTEKRPNIRKRPGHRNRVNPGEPFEAEIVTEIVHTPLNTYKDPTESVQRYYENNQFVTNQPINQYSDYTSQKFTEDQREDTTEAVPLEYLTEITRHKPENIPENEDYNRQQGGSIVTNIPLEELFIKTDDNYYDRATATSSTTPSIPTTTPTTTTTAEPTTQLPQVSSTTTRPHKMRPMRYGNTTRPRFSIKDYKSRLDYKSRNSQTSTTDSTVTSAPQTKQRGSNFKHQQSQQNQQQQNGDANRETTGRYKYVSRVNYRTTSQSPISKDQELPVPEEGVSSTTEKSNRFVPKRRPIGGNVYRSRISGTTANPPRSQQHHESETPSRASTARPENVFSSSVRRRPIMKSRLPTQKETSTATHGRRREEEATEMAAEETSFYSAITTMATTRVVANEIPVSEKGETVVSTNLPAKLNAEEEDTVEKSETETSTLLGNEKRPVEPVFVSSTAKNEEESQVKEAGITELDSTVKEEETVTEKESKDENTTRFDIRTEEEELFAKASQSVADLTSSASALYDKPGMFKAVSPESRIVSPHFKITTDEPTLPIEAFFQELSKKN